MLAHEEKWKFVRRQGKRGTASSDRSGQVSVMELLGYSKTARRVRDIDSYAYLG